MEAAQRSPGRREGEPGKRSWKRIHRVPLVVTVVLLCWLAVSCAAITTGPARTPTTYEHKAATTAESASSSVATTLLAVQAAGDDKAFGPYLSILVSNAEDALGAAASTFEGIQPPSAESDAVRDELVDLLDAATDDVSRARILIRRGENTAAAELAEPLRQRVDELTAFAEAYR